MSDSTLKGIDLEDSTVVGIVSNYTRNAAAAMAGSGGPLVSSNAGKMFDMLES